MRKSTKKSNRISIFALVLILGLIASSPVLAAAKFNKNLSYGLRNNADVKNLQQFLLEAGYFNRTPDGNFLSATLQSVKDFQRANKIPATGFVGAMTRTAINSGSVVSSVGTPGGLSITSHKGGERLEVGNKQKLTWTSNNYSSPEVKVNIIKKVGENPHRYELVRTVGGKISNKGSATWVPAKSDIGNNVFIEVGCKETRNACKGSITGSSLAIVDSTSFANTASAFDSIEKSENK